MVLPPAVAKHCFRGAAPTGLSFKKNLKYVHPPISDCTQGPCM